jgi:hypothetical protein
MLQLTVYYSYWFIVICCAIYKWYSGSLFDADWKYKKEMKKKEAGKWRKQQRFIHPVLRTCALIPKVLNCVQAWIAGGGILHLLGWTCHPTIPTSKCFGIPDPVAA